jgi:hypothetical protein
MAKQAPSMANITKSTAKKVVTKKAAPKAATKKPAVKSTDLISASSHEVENLTKAKALKLAPELIDAEGMNDFKLGGVLQRIQEEKWWEGDDHESFKDYIEKGLGLPYRKCMYLVNIYDKLVAAGISWDQVKSIGWSKLRFIVDYLDESNVAEWVKRAKSMNSLEIQEYIKSLKAGDSEKNAKETGETTKISSMVFKLHADQKETVRTGLDKNKADTGTEHDAVALENIVLAYLDGSLGKTKAKPVTEAAVKKFLGNLDTDKAAAIVISVHPSLGGDDEEEEAEEQETL